MEGQGPLVVIPITFCTHSFFVFKRNILEKKRGIVESSRQKDLVRNGCFSMTTLPHTRVLPVNTLYSATRWSFVSLRREQVLNLFPRFDGTHIHPHRFYLPVSLFFPPFFSFFFSFNFQVNYNQGEDMALCH